MFSRRECWGNVYTLPNRRGIVNVNMEVTHFDIIFNIHLECHLRRFLNGKRQSIINISAISAKQKLHS